MKKKAARIGGFMAAVIAVILGIRYWRYSLRHESTDDAFIATDIIPIAPKVAGEITDVYVNDNQKVSRGQVLIQIDPRDYQAKLAQAQAELERARANREKTKLDVARYRSLSQKDEASQQEYDHALAADGEAKAEVALALAVLSQARLNVSYTRITAPSSGQISQKSAVAGMYAQVGQAVMAIVPNNLWVIANFKESQVANMSSGDRVKIEVDAYPGRIFEGRVDSIQSGTGAAFSLLPPENATGNYVKVVQRIPVKIVFDGDPDAARLLAVGMSVIPTVAVR
ncbi:MAG: HlyD family secretion protein [Elusimicrobiota bacterium]